MVGQAFDYTFLEPAAKNEPGLRLLKGGSGVVSGAALGLLNPVEAGTKKSEWSQRLAGAAEGAIYIGAMEGANALLTKSGVENAFIKSTASGAIAEAISIQVSTKINTGHFASVEQTAQSALAWGATGAAFGGAGHFLGKRAAAKIATSESDLVKARPVDEPSWPLQNARETTASQAPQTDHALTATGLQHVKNQLDRITKIF